MVIGTDVADYYAPLAKELGLDEKSQESSEKKALSRCLWIQSPVYSDQLFQQSLGQE
ncbi:PTS system, beta-glucoside-specific IIA, IIB, and IIC component [Enterococcus sp. HSIEG1]|nr:PTS system, beta-glucoside-specific IIA, IIB, and IIC component [Enterococcus sp. HSIEG1]